MSNNNRNRNYGNYNNGNWNPNNPNNRKPDHGLAHMSWGIIVFLYFVWWPVGLLMTILKIIDMQAEKNEQLGRSNWVNQMNGRYQPFGTYNSNPYRAYPGTAQQNYTAEQRARQKANSGPASVPPTQQQAANQSNSGANRTPYTVPYQHQPTLQQQQAAKLQKLSIIGLIVIAVFAFVTGVPELSTAVSFASFGALTGYEIVHYLLSGLIKTLGGVGLSICAARMARGKRRESVLATIVGTRDSISLHELTAACGFGSKKTLQLAKDAIQHGLFGPYSYIDMASQTLVVRGPAPKPAEPKEKAKSTAAVPKDENKYQAILRQLREANDKIPGEEMTAKISKMEALSARIFQLAEDDPKKAPQLNKFMDYYLPTSLKLLDTYATLDHQGLEGQNITETKASIENAMDLLVKAFEAQLDKLFQNDALDVSGDIAALQSMMSMDGLTEGDFQTSMGDPKLDKKYDPPKDDD